MRALHLMQRVRQSVSPRGRPTVEWPSPVITFMRRPFERVLFSAARDAHPFFHFFESLWMLAGRNDVAFPARFVKRMNEFSDDGLRLYGAYGDRWRRRFGMDQIQTVISRIREDPDTRRAVIAMYDPFTDPCYTGRDLPCNTHLYFKLRQKSLRMTVSCRSNDILWGAYGANAVHFSMLQEYIACKLGVSVGGMYQLSDSWHAYLDGPGGELWEKLCGSLRTELYNDLYRTGDVRAVSLGAGSAAWDKDLSAFMEAVDDGRALSCPPRYTTSWFQGVVSPMWRAWMTRKLDDAVRIVATDWRTAAINWLDRRSVT